MTDAFGVVAMVAMTPLITIQILGFVYQLQENRTAAADTVEETIPVIPLEEKEVMHIGYILNKDKELSELGEIYVEALKQYQT